jgi:arginase
MNAALRYDIEIISAPSILGLRPSGVEDLGKSLLDSGLADKLQCGHPVVHVPALNELYSEKRNPKIKCLNADAIRDHSVILGKSVSDSISHQHFPFVLGGDCSILIGIMSALKKQRNYGLIFMDAHADYYRPEQSITGEVADMDLAIVTGKGPELLTNIDGLRPYVKEENVIHVGQRDWEETKKYGSADIRETNIRCYDLATITVDGIDLTTNHILQNIEHAATENYWIHFDTDVLSDEINPAVDYRLPGGLTFIQVEHLLAHLLSTGKMAGISVTIFNPRLDKDGSISRNISECLSRAFSSRLE